MQHRSKMHGGAAALRIISTLLLAAGCLGTESADSEEPIMLKLRQAVVEAEPVLAAGWHGWKPNDPAHHCGWDHVHCEQGHVTSLLLLSTAKPQAGAAPEGQLRLGTLLPELAQLQRLESLLMKFNRGPLYASIPPVWGHPGAFPRLKRLSLQGLHLCEPLPDLQPGSFPVLQEVHLELGTSTLALPPSWGASPLVLPALRWLWLQLQPVGPLPPEWALGFAQLRLLHVEDKLSDELPWRADPHAEGRMSTVDNATAPVRNWPLPTEWAAGFPKLEALMLSSAEGRISGTIPAAWVEGGFPSLQQMELGSPYLGGTLPEQLFANHPALVELSLENSQFSGTLPAAWASSNATRLSLSNNKLGGHAFPDAWIQPGAFRHLGILVLSGNLGLVGTLPDKLPWPHITYLEVDDTGLDGSIPDSWCQPPIASTLQHLSIVGTAVSQEAPSCTKRMMLNTLFVTDVGAINPNYVPSHVAATQAHWPVALVAALTTLQLVLLTVLAASIVAGGILFRQSRWWRLSGKAEESGQLETLRMLGAHNTLSLGAGTTSDKSSALAVQLSPAVAGGRRARVAALLSNLMHVPARTEGAGMAAHLVVQLRPEEELHAMLAHQLVLLPSRRAAGGSSGSSKGPSAGGGYHVEAPSQDLGSSNRMAATKGGAGDGQLACQAAPALELDTKQATAVDASGMPTKSMRLSCDELEFVVGTSGEFVELGAGSFAVVYLARLQGKPVAVKVFELDVAMDSNAVWHEVSLLRHCTHPRIVPLLGVAVKGDLVLLVMQLMQGGSLRSALSCPYWRHALRWVDKGRQVAVDMAEALHFLHSQQVIHSDLKSANVLLSQDGHAFLADLGLAQVLAGEAASVAGFTSLYAAPEQLLGQRCTVSADMYSFGILLIELLTQKPRALRVQLKLPQAPEQCPPGVLALIKACIYSAPSERPTAAEALAQLRAEAAGAGHAPWV